MFANHADHHHGSSTGQTSTLGRSDEGISHREPSNLGGSTDRDISTDDNVQHASVQGIDPNLEKFKSDKLTGTGQDGSHSAVFGLTPDGHKHDDTSHARTTAPIPADNEGKTSKHDSTAHDDGSRGVGTGKVAEQMHDPNVADKGHGGSADHGNDNNKPGAGVNTSNII